MTELKQMRLLITPTSFGQKDPAIFSRLEEQFAEVIRNPYGRPLSSVELIALIGEVDGFIAGLDDINAAVFDAAAHLKVVSRYGVGYEKVDMAAANQHGVVVTNTPGANSVSVAELTIGLILSVARRLCTLNAATRQGEWPRSDGIGLRGKTVGLVGLGAIGIEVADRLRAFGCRLLAMDPIVSPERAAEHGVSLVSLDEMLPQADIISLHAPVVAETRGMVNHEFLAKVKPGVILINTARGQLINEADLVDALHDRRVRGVGMDAFETEPPGAGNPLFEFPQVIATPHTGAHTDDAIITMTEMAVENCLAVLRGERPAFVVNPLVYDQKGSLT